jgi:hypothetical protein
VPRTCGEVTIIPTISKARILILLMNFRLQALCIHIIISTGLITPMSIRIIMRTGRRKGVVHPMIIVSRIVNIRANYGF